MALLRSDEWVAAVDGLRSGIANATHASPAALDPAVLRAVDFAHTADLSKLSDLRPYVEQVYGDLSLDNGAFYRLQGYVGEQVAMDQLQSLGHDVELAPFSNEPGWDLLVDGEPVNVKTVSDASSIYEHFEKYPHIPVVTSPEMAEQVAGAGYEVVGLDGLGAEDIQGRMAETVESLTDIGDSALDSVAAHALEAIVDYVPIVTTVKSGARELRLIRRGETDLAAASRNIGWDVAGVGGGILLASVLTAGAPLSVAICLTIALPVGGRKLTDWWKRGNLRKHRKELLTSYCEYQPLVDAANADIQARAKTLIRQEEAAMRRSAQLAEDRLAATRDHARSQAEALAVRAEEVWTAELDAIEAFQTARARPHSRIVTFLPPLRWWLNEVASEGV